jgi:uncharacterized protein YgbK (DUF1537 family)
VSVATRPLLGCIADDFTGATDLANMLVRGGMRTIQTIGVPANATDIAADALVVALKSRTVPAPEAVAASLAALRWLVGRGCRQFFFKYCSTFDSTDAGNIGPVADALLRELGQDFTLACPAFPENGRTVFRGYLFVGDALLSESGMQHHPLTPMTDANLVRVLQRQTTAKVGLLRYDAVAAGAEATTAAMSGLRKEGVRIAIADAVSNADLRTLGAACAGLALVTGGSGIALGLPDNFRRAGLLAQSVDAGELPATHGPALVLAGSSSQATNLQVAAWNGARPSFRIDARALGRGEPVVAAALAFVAEHRGVDALVYATATPDDVKAVQGELGVERAGALVEAALAEIARECKARGTRIFVVAGGETSGAVVQALGVNALRIGTQIDTGVPATLSLDDPPLALALKSGNFGGVDFFAKAIAHLETPGY